GKTCPPAETSLGQDAGRIDVCDVAERGITVPSRQDLLLLEERLKPGGIHASQTASLVDPIQLGKRELGGCLELGDLELDRQQSRESASRPTLDQEALRPLCQRRSIVDGYAYEGARRGEGELSVCY